jgi:hypothetical protein
MTKKIYAYLHINNMTDEVTDYAVFPDLPAIILAIKIMHEAGLGVMVG